MEPVRKRSTLRVCRRPGCPRLQPEPECAEHRAETDKARGTKEQRGYQSAHRREAKMWRALIAAGHTVTCWRCHLPITNPTDCHLGHDDNRAITRGPEHARCNLTAAGKAAHQ